MGWRVAGGRWQGLAAASAAGVVEHAERRAGMALTHLLVIPWHPTRATLRRGRLTSVRV